MHRLAILSPDGNRLVAATLPGSLRQALALAVSVDCPVRFTDSTEPVSSFDRICVCHGGGWRWVQPNQLKESRNAVR